METVSGATAGVTKNDAVANATKNDAVADATKNDAVADATKNPAAGDATKTAGDLAKNSPAAGALDTAKGATDGLGLKYLLDLNLDNPKQILAVGDEEEKAAIGVLARKKQDEGRKKKGEKELTDEEWEKQWATEEGKQAAIAGLDLSNPEILNIGGEEGKGKLELLAKKKKEREAKPKPCPPSEGVFYGFAVPKGGNPQAPRYAITFASPQVADEYAKQLEKDHPNHQARPSSQFFVLPSGKDAKFLYNEPGYERFKDQMFLTQVGGPGVEEKFASIPPQDRRGHIYSYEFHR